MNRRTSSGYITLTPRSTHNAPSSSASFAKDVMKKKLEALNKKNANIAHTKEDSRVLDNELIKNSPTDTEVSSDAGDEADAPEQDDEDLDAEAALDVFPTYVCELHDPKRLLQAEHIRGQRIEIVPVDSTCLEGKRLWGWRSNHEFQYEIVVGSARTVFSCTPLNVLNVLKTLFKDVSIANQLKFIETNYFRDGFVGSMKRLYPSTKKLSEEIMEVLEAISDVDVVLQHPAYLKLIQVSAGTVFHNELNALVKMHKEKPRVNDSPTKCMCDTYQMSVDRFGDFYKQHAESTGTPRCSVVASESLMFSRNILSFYTDTVFLLDKRDFHPVRGLNKCDIYGFGRRKLFEIVRTSRKQWSFRNCTYAVVATLTLERYMHHMNPQHTVAIKRHVPDMNNGIMREENVCFVKKSRRTHGYHCLLMSEVISRGRVTTSLAIEETTSVEGDPYRHYMTMSEVSGSDRESVCSSTLSVPTSRHKHFQHLHVGGGSDVITFLSLALSYDILVRGLTYWREKRY